MSAESALSTERSPHRRGRADGGFTLPEVLVTTSIVAVIVTALAAAISITFVQSTNSEGRLNVARAEQAIDTWLPADLASTDVNDSDLPGVDLNPAANPCGNCSNVDLSGSNALQLAWKTTSPGSPPTETITRVQYQYVERDGEWVIERIQCIGSDPCTATTVLHDLAAPADLGSYDPNTVRPIWVMDVAVPEPDPSLQLNDNARQVTVTVDGGGDGAGAFGGENTISLTAGGGSTKEISADDFTVPSFVRANSRCGGPVTLIVDESGSVGSAIENVVEPGVNAFIDAFRGTPTQVQIVSFSNDAEAVGGGGAWHHYVDMTDDAAVDALKAVIAGELGAGGGTNWEEAFFHTLKESDGTDAMTLPNRIVFFTDGIPTRNRTSSRGRSDRGEASWHQDYSNGDRFIHYNDGPYNDRWPVDDGRSFNQESWDRADVILDQHRDIDLIFVGVGSDLDNTIKWQHRPEVYSDASVRPPSKENRAAWETITYLLMNGSNGEVPAIYDGGAGEYTNPETANWYKQSSFDSAAFGAAMTAAALKDCGGTLTIQTRFADGTPVPDEFVYENVDYRTPDGGSVEAEARRVTTSSVFRTGTFDFEITGGVPFFSVDVVPQELQTLTDYTPVGWSCRAGGAAKTTTAIDIVDSPFEGFTVDVSANEAVSCILTVSS